MPDRRRFRTLLPLALCLSAAAAAPALGAADAATGPAPRGGNVVLHDFTYGDGETSPKLRLHYVTLGTPARDAVGRISNAVLLLHGTTGTAETFLKPAFAGALFGPGQPLDVARYFVVIPDGIGAGGSSKPSDGLHARFPHYGYNDQVRAQHALLRGIGVEHVAVVLGTSMGGMQTWLWGETYPDDMDALVAVASTPAPISGRNMLWREMVIQAIRSDPDWHGGDYPADLPPRAWARTAMPLFTIMTGNAEQLEMEAPTRSAAVALVGKQEDAGRKFDADDLLYVFESSFDYDPRPKLGAITKPMLTVNFGDDLLNPPELLHLPTASNFTAVMLPGGSESFGHETLAHPAAWASALASFLRQIAPRK